MFWIIALLSAIFCGFFAGWLLIVICNNSMNLAYRLTGLIGVIIMAVGVGASLYLFAAEIISKIKTFFNRKRTA